MLSATHQKRIAKLLGCAMSPPQLAAVLGQLANQTVEQIAAAMGISPRGVQLHLAQAKANFSPEQRERYAAMLNVPEAAEQVRPIQLSVCPGVAA